jgi:hypothetical protein
MEIDRDTFLVTVYTLIDDLLQQEFLPHKPVRPGPAPQMSDSEVLTVLLCGQWLGNSERRFLRYVRQHWRSYFPHVLSQSAFNRRARDLAGVLVHLVPRLGQLLSASANPYQLLDGAPLPLARQCRGRRHRLFANEASVGRGGSDRDFYYGCQLLLAVDAMGIITGFVVAPAATEERCARRAPAESLLCWRSERWREPWQVADLPAPQQRRGVVGPTGPIWPRDGVGEPDAEVACYLADRGLAGVVWQTHWYHDYAAAVITARQYDRLHDRLPLREQRSRRQMIESVNSGLAEALHLAFPRARTRWGLLTRVAAKLVSFNLAIWINRLLGRPDLAVATLFPG